MSTMSCKEKVRHFSGLRCRNLVTSYSKMILNTDELEKAWGVALMWGMGRCRTVARGNVGRWQTVWRCID